MSGDRAVNLHAALRQQCEMADSGCYAYGHHCVERAAQVLAGVAKMMERGIQPHSIEATTAVATAVGYLDQYQSWLKQFLLGRIHREPQDYEGAIALLQQQLESTQAVSKNGSN